MLEAFKTFVPVYAIALTTAYFLRKSIHKTATKAINDKVLTVGIYSLFPVKGEKAVELANGYIKGANIIFWFVVFFFPFVYIITFLK